MDAVIRAILHFSRLEVILIRINNQTTSTFDMELEGRISSTGPIAATLLPMTVDMTGPNGVFGKALLPEIKANSFGTKVYVPTQTVKIISHEAFEAFVKSIQQDKSLVLQLENGSGRVKALFMSANFKFRKDIDIIGIDGPSLEVVKTEPRDNGTFKNTLKIVNPSPVEITVPPSTFHYIDEDGTIIAEQQHDELSIIRGTSYHEVTGAVRAKNPRGQLRFTGITVEQVSWMKETIKYFDSDINLTPQFASLTS